MEYNSIREEKKEFLSVSLRHQECEGKIKQEFAWVFSSYCVVVSENKSRKKIIQIGCKIFFALVRTQKSQNCITSKWIRE